MIVNSTTAVIALISLIVIVPVILAVSSFYFYSVAVKRSRKYFLKDNKDLVQIHENNDADQISGRMEERTSDGREEGIHDGTEGDFHPNPVEGADWVESHPYETWEIVSEDGLKLKGYFLPARTATTKSVVLAHGYTSRGKDMGSFAGFYYDKLGYNVLMPDDRGHGASEGDYIGFGWPDRKDYLLWINKLIDRVGSEAQIVLHGISMGGAAVMMISGEELPGQVKAIVEDCGYTSVHDQLAYQLKRMYHLPGFPVMLSTSILTKVRAGYYFREASALKQVEKSKTPILFIHGDSDTFVPYEMMRKLFNACKAEKDIYVVKDAGHGMAYSADKPAYEKKVSQFIGRFVR